MAGPFSSTGGAGDIPAVQLRGGFAPDPGIAGAVADSLNVALPAIRDNHVKNLKEDVTGQIQSIEDALLAARNPAVASSLFRDEALANPITAQAFKEFTQIQDAAAQGILPQQFALERLEVIQNTAISNAPEFEREIRAAMQQATGQDPSKTLFNQLLSTQQATLSPEQKGLNQLRKEATQNGVTVEQQQEINHQIAIAQLEQGKLDRKKAQGTYALLDATTETSHRAGGIMLDLVGAMRREVNRTGSLSPEFTKQLSLQAGTAIAAATAQITAGAKGVDGGQIANAIAPLEKLRGQIDGMLEDTSMQAFVSSNNTLSKAILEEGILKMPDYAAAWAFGGQRGFLDMLKFMEQAPTKESKVLVSELSGGAKQAFLLQNITQDMVAQQYGKLGSEEKAETPEEKNARLLAATLALGTAGLEEDKQVTALQEMRDIDEQVAWASFGSRKVITAVSQSKSLQAAFFNMQVNQTAGLATEYMELANNSGVDLNRFTFEGDTLKYTSDTSDLGGVNSENVANANAFASRFNRANKISATHMAAGTLPSTRYTNTQNYWGVVTQDAKDAVSEATMEADAVPSVVKWGRDSTGRPVRID